MTATKPLVAMPAGVQPGDVTGLPEVSIVLPCLNEARTLAGCIAQASRATAAMGIASEIIVADNGSTDGSPEIAITGGARVVSITQTGYGAAVMGGVDAACGQWIVMGDADGSYDFSHIPRFIEKLRSGYELVMGNRFLGGIQPDAMPALHRYFGNPLLSGIARAFFRSPCRDFHCGLRGFSREAIRRLEMQTTGMEFASEMVVKATLYGLRIAEVPTTLAPDRRGRPPHLRRWRDGWRHLRFLLAYSPRWLFLYPGLALVAVGLVLAAWLISGPRKIGGVTFDVHTLLYACLTVLVGAQALLFAVLSKAFSITAGLIPGTPALKRLFGKITLETGIAVGGACLALGIGLMIAVLVMWVRVDFGDLQARHTLRLAIPGATATALGLQVIMASFLLSLMGMARR
jgi:glycosyltransferase involved in cell wall biosynthesis